MPLPGNGVLSLQGHSKPGDTQYSKPKQAMIVRMSTETLDALESQPKMQFEFGDNPGIYIGDTFFPMKPSKETLPHELYLRTSSAAKPNMPLKLNALITGKFMVERELDPKLQDKIRGRVIQAEKQRTERKAIILENPPHTKPLKNTKKTKAAPRRVPPADPLRAASSPLPPRPQRVPPPSHPTLAERDPTVRTRLIHCLALKHRPTAEVIRLVGLQVEDKSTIDDLIALLNEVATQTHQLSTAGEQISRWKLKPVAWKEVEPLEWPQLSSQERNLLCAEAARAFELLKIPPSDPCWNNIRRDPKINGSSPGAGPSTELPPKPEPRKPLIPPKKKAKVDAPPKRSPDTITAKDERVRPLKVDVAKSKEKAMDEGSGAGTPTSSKPSVARRLPGSGYRARPGSNTPTPPAHDPTRGGSLPPKRPVPSDTQVKMEISSPLPSTLSSTRNPLPSSHTPPSHALPKKPKDPQGTTASRALEVREKGGKTSPSQVASSVGVKRKPKEEPESEYSEKDVPTSSGMLKRRKIGDGQAPRDRQKEMERLKEREYEAERTEKVKGKERDPSLPKKPVTQQDGSSMPPPPHRITKIRKDTSPAYPPARSPLPPAHSPTHSVRSPLPPPPARSPIPPSRSPMPHGRSPLVTAHNSPSKSSASERVVSGSASSHKASRIAAAGGERGREGDRERERGREKDRQAHRANGSAKPRRKSPIYTSSEDESSHPSAPDHSTPSSGARRGGAGVGLGISEEESKASVTIRTAATATTKATAAAAAATATTNAGTTVTTTTTTKSKMISRKVKRSTELPRSAEGLRKLYDAKWPSYMKLYHRHAQAVHTIKKMLSRDLDEATDSDLDIDVSNSEQATTLKEELDMAERELIVIREAHANLRKSDGES